MSESFGIDEKGRIWILVCEKCERMPLMWDLCQKQKCPVERFELGRVWMHEVHGKPIPPVTEYDQ